MGKLTTVYGGQFGSEGKGQIAGFLFETALREMGAAAWDFKQATSAEVATLRIGGPNAGHTFYHPTGGKVVVQSLPVGAYFGATAVIGAAGLIILELLVEEVKLAKQILGRKPKLYIDKSAVLIDTSHMKQETELKTRIGSTGEGVGAATAQKVMRDASITAQFNSELLQDALSPYADLLILHTPPLLNGMALLDDSWLLVEGTQGVGLSLHTSGFYPYCTSRECTPLGIYAEAGINDRLWDESRIMVVRTFPIRVGGNSGPLSNEISWEDLYRETNGYVSKPEITTVTKKPRRIGRIDHDYLHNAVLQTNPTHLALTFLDYEFPVDANKKEMDDLSPHALLYVSDLSIQMGVPVTYVSTGPGCTVRLY